VQPGKVHTGEEILSMDSQAVWLKECPAAVTVCDRQGKILEMNDAACKAFAKYGGRELVGKNLLDCHPEPAREKIRKMLAEPTTDCYTVEMQGKKKLVYQMPWFSQGRFSGIMEIMLEIPADIPHFIRG